MISSGLVVSCLVDSMPHLLILFLFGGNFNNRAIRSMYSDGEPSRESLVIEEKARQADKVVESLLNELNKVVYGCFYG